MSQNEVVLNQKAVKMQNKLSKVGECNVELGGCNFSLRNAKEGRAGGIPFTA